MFQKFSRPVLKFIFVSLVLHMVVVLSLAIFENLPPKAKTEEIEISVIESPPKQQTESSPEKQQIVEQKEQLNDEVPEDSKFLSAFNQRVAKETRAQKTGAFTNLAEQGTPQSGDPTPQKEKPEKAKRGELPDLAALRPKFNPQPLGQENNGPNGRPSQTDDYIKDVDVGIQTLLSTNEFVYFSYYNRIKEQLRQHWEPSVRQRVKMIYKQGRSVASAKDLITQVQITLNKDGALVKVEVLNQSGIQALDEAAIEAFKEASPFPNPPQGMIESDGTVRLRWDFILEASMQIFDMKHYASLAP